MTQIYKLRKITTYVLEPKLNRSIIIMRDISLDKIKDKKLECELNYMKDCNNFRLVYEEYYEIIVCEDERIRKPSNRRME